MSDGSCTIVGDRMRTAECVFRMLGLRRVLHASHCALAAHTHLRWTSRRSVIEGRTLAPEAEQLELLLAVLFLLATRVEGLRSTLCHLCQGWKKQREVGIYYDGKIIMVSFSDPKFMLKKMEEIGQMVDRRVARFQFCPFVVQSTLHCAKESESTFP